MKKYSYLITGAIALLAASCGRTVNPNKAPKTAVDSFSYSVGYQIGKTMRDQGIEKLDYSAFIKGVEEATKKDSGFAINPDIMPELQQRFVTKEREKKIKVFKEESKKWMAENAKKAGVTLLPSKGQFKMITAGNGPIPGYYDSVTYHILVKTSKGTEIYDSKKRGGERTMPVFQMGLAPVEEGFQKAPAGSTFEVYVQNDAFPDMGQQQSLESQYGVSVYTVSVSSVKPGKAPAPPKEGEAGQQQMPSMPSMPPPSPNK